MENYIKDEKYKKYHLLLDRVFVRPLNLKEKELNRIGLVAPDTIKKEGTEIGEVLAVGEGGYLRCPKCDHGFYNLPVHVKVGDKVIFKRFNFQEIITEEGENLLICYSRDLIGLIEL